MFVFVCRCWCLFVLVCDYVYLLVFFGGDRVCLFVFASACLCLRVFACVCLIVYECLLLFVFVCV